MLPPTSRWWPAAAMVCTAPEALLANVLTTLPVLVPISAMFCTVVPLTEVNLPPI
jgi:hypothetical protein